MVIIAQQHDYLNLISIAYESHEYIIIVVS